MLTRDRAARISSSQLYATGNPGRNQADQAGDQDPGQARALQQSQARAQPPGPKRAPPGTKAPGADDQVPAADTG
jgi:hypothetical protein